MQFNVMPWKDKIDRISATTLPKDCRVNITGLNKLIQCGKGIL